MSYDLLTERWIPAILTDGSAVRLSIRDAFTRASEVRRISADLPTQSFAVLRLLLAIHHDAVGFHRSADVAASLRVGLDQSTIAAYLDRYADRFDLFHPERPFMQVVGLRTAKDEASPLEKLISDVPNGAPFLTTRGGEALRVIPAHEAALWVVHAQAFDAAGIRSGAVGDPEVKAGKGYPIGPAWAGQIGGVVLHGQTLAHTLVYNVVPTPENPLDRPVWTNDVPQTAVRQMEPDPQGPVQVLVWQSRRIRLVGDRDGVTGVVLAQGDRMTPQNRQSLEHMTAWRYSEPQSKKHKIPVYMPRKHDPSRAAWRGMPGLVSDAPSRTADGHEESIRPATVASLAGHSEQFTELDTEVVVELVGIEYGPQEATVNDMVHDSLDLRLRMLGEDAAEVQLMLYDVVRSADQAVWALGRMAANIASAAGDFDGVDGARDRARETAWAELDHPARSWLGTLDADTDTIEARRDWHRRVAAVTETLAARMAVSCSPAAVTGRMTKFGYMTAAKAESYLRAALRKELVLAYPQDPNKEADNEQ